tara:strand:- start:133 stop:429 length:297 start_codon:yes stop_codon:yes gene_type:complete
MITYPDKPWTNGEQFTYTTSDGSKVVGTYNSSKNAWEFTRIGVVTTNEVETINTRPTEITNPFALTDDPFTIANQQEVNWYLYDQIVALQNQITTLTN